MNAQHVMEEMQAYASDADGVFLQRFFKTGPGQYGEGDIFIGVKVPVSRKIATAYKKLPFEELQILLDSPIHEHRLVALIILTNQYSAARSDDIKQHIFDFYIHNVYKNRVNNWDLVDTSCYKIVGEHLFDRERDILLKLAQGNDLWQKRVAMVSTLGFLKNGDPSSTLELAELLWQDQHDLMQKATGWMLREMGKRVDGGLLATFLDEHAHELPRTCLRYAIEHLSPQQKTHYMNAKATLAPKTAIQ